MSLIVGHRMWFAMIHLIKQDQCASVVQGTFLCNLFQYIFKPNKIILSTILIFDEKRTISQITNTIIFDHSIQCFVKDLEVSCCQKL